MGVKQADGNRQSATTIHRNLFEAVNPLQRGPVDVKEGGVPSLLLSKVHYQLHSLAYVKKEVAALTPAGQALYFLQAGLFIVTCDQAHYICFISKCDNSV